MDKMNNQKRKLDDLSLEPEAKFEAEKIQTNKTTLSRRIRLGIHSSLINI